MTRQHPSSEIKRAHELLQQLTDITAEPHTWNELVQRGVAAGLFRAAPKTCECCGAVTHEPEWLRFLFGFIYRAEGTPAARVAAQRYTESKGTSAARRKA